jgi:hypothetical protein
MITLNELVYKYVSEHPQLTTSQITKAIVAENDYAPSSVTVQIHKLAQVNMLKKTKVGRRVVFSTDQPFNIDAVNQDIARLRRERIEKLTSVSQSISSSDTKTFIHSYMIRPGLFVKIELPADVTKAEAERIASFIKMVPFE